MTFSADKSVSALWAIADPASCAERIERWRTTTPPGWRWKRRCSVTAPTRVVRDREGQIRVLTCRYRRGDVPARHQPRERPAAPYPLPHLQRGPDAREDGKWRAMHQYPVYSWAKAAGAVYRNALAWNLRERLGVQRSNSTVPMARSPGSRACRRTCRSSGRSGARRSSPKPGSWASPTLGNASRMAGVNKLTRAGKSHDNDPEVRHGRWRDEAQSFAEREKLIAAVTAQRGRDRP